MIQDKIIKQKYLHLGQNTKLTSQSLCRHILCSRKDIEIFDDYSTKLSFIKLFNIFKKLQTIKSNRQLTVLFCSTNKIYGGILKNAAKSCDMPHKIHRWLGGTLTGAISLDVKPDFLFIPDVKDNALIIKEAKIMGIPIIGIVNSSCNIKIDYPIFGNDSNIKIVLRLTQLVAALVRSIKL